MSTEENKKLIERLYDKGLNRHDAPAAAAFYAADALNHGQRVGRAGMQAVFEALFNTFPDFRYQVEESTAEADRVVCKVTMTGTHLGQPTLPQAFTGMLTSSPSWYVGPYGTSFNPVYFSNSMSHMATTAGQTFASAPRSSSSGSGFGGGGGGFSGGGFGGGGTGAF